MHAQLSALHCCLEKQRRDGRRVLHSVYGYEWGGVGLNAHRLVPVPAAPHV